MQGGSNEESRSAWRGGWPFSAAIAIAAVPVLGFLFAYLYELGYTWAFGIPVELIKLTNLDVLRIWIPVSALVITTLGMGPFFFLFLPVEALPRLSRLLPPVLVIAVGATYLTVVRAGWVSFMVLMGMAVVLLAPSLFAEFRKKSKEASRRKPVIMDELVSTVGSAWIWAVLTVIALAIGVALIGWSYGTGRTSFIAIVGDPANAVVLRMYDNIAVTATIRMDAGGRYYLDGVFTIYDLSALSGQRIRMVSVGPLVRGAP